MLFGHRNLYRSIFTQIQEQQKLCSAQDQVLLCSVSPTDQRKHFSVFFTQITQTCSEEGGGGGRGWGGGGGSKWRNRGTTIHCEKKKRVYSIGGFCVKWRNHLPGGSGQDAIWLERAGDIRASLHAFLIHVRWREPADLPAGTQQWPLNTTKPQEHWCKLVPNYLCN